MERHFTQTLRNFSPDLITQVLRHLPIALLLPVEEMRSEGKSSRSPLLDEQSHCNGHRDHTCHFPSLRVFCLFVYLSLSKLASLKLCKLIHLIFFLLFLCITSTEKSLRKYPGLWSSGLNQ